MKTVLMLVVFLNGGDPTGVEALNMEECKKASTTFNIENLNDNLPVVALCSEVERNADGSINTMDAILNAQ